MMSTTTQDRQHSHNPVLYHETIKALQSRSQGRYVDCTVGAGGHAFGILQASSPDGQLLCLDADPHALEVASQRLSDFASRVTLLNVSFITLEDQLRNIGWNSVDGILLDLGISSMQLDDPARGFSFQRNGPLDMRFNPGQSLQASDMANNLPENQLADLLWRYSNERNSRQIARAICKARPLNTTLQLAEVVLKAVPHDRKRKIHPATRTFQALRIAVNEELKALETILPVAVSALSPGGRLAVISFHSLEDRIVKNFFRRESRDCICPPSQPICTCDHKASLNVITRRPIKPTKGEVKSNPRARSARLRFAEKLKLA